ncbi:Cupin_5 domain-containing protein [Pseudozyma hubeiensis]|nr:Cupin_5 domain-containing protein [Pseudozyma hubeiensis]
MSQLYHFPQTSEELIRHYKLEPHPEGGYYAVTHVMKETIKSPFASDSEERSISSCIYYLLCHKTPGCPDKPSLSVSSDEPDAFKTWNSDIGVLHLNKSSTMHVHHAGRAKYTLISAKAPLGQGLKDSNGDPLTKIVVMGDDIANGEVRQLSVEGGWWKVSEIPEQDRNAVEDGTADGARVGALISEVVTPGFHWNDHTYLNQSRLRELFAGTMRSDELYEGFKKYVKEQ